MTPEATERISLIIQGVVGTNEDAFQDAWAEVLGKHLVDDAEIRKVAGKCRRRILHQVMVTKYTTVSLERPLSGEDGRDFSMRDIIEAPLDEFPIVSARPRGGIQGRRSIEVDQDVVDAMRARFGNMALAQIVRVMLGLPLKMAENAWQEEEDQLIRAYYPTMGGPPLAKLIDRSADCIRERASNLGVRRQWEYKRDRRAYNVIRRARARTRRGH